MEFYVALVVLWGMVLGNITWITVRYKRDHGVRLVRALLNDRPAMASGAAAAAVLIAAAVSASSAWTVTLVWLIPQLMIGFLIATGVHQVRQRLSR